jgi:hypothetical protein
VVPLSTRPAPFAERAGVILGKAAKIILKLRDGLPKIRYYVRCH